MSERMNAIDAIRADRTIGGSLIREVRMASPPVGMHVVGTRGELLQHLADDGTIQVDNIDA